MYPLRQLAQYHPLLVLKTFPYFPSLGRAAGKANFLIYGVINIPKHESLHSLLLSIVVT